MNQVKLKDIQDNPASFIPQSFSRILRGIDRVSNGAKLEKGMGEELRQEGSRLKSIQVSDKGYIQGQELKSCEQPTRIIHHTIDRVSLFPDETRKYQEWPGEIVSYIIEISLRYSQFHPSRDKIRGNEIRKSIDFSHYRDRICFHEDNIFKFQELSTRKTKRVRDKK